MDTSGVLFAQFFRVTRGDDISSFVGSDFFAYTIPFLFMFAVVYGLLSHANVPNNKPSQVVIGLVAGFLVLPLAPILVGIMSTLSSSIVITIGAFLILIVLFELLGLRSSKVIETDAKGNPTKVVEGTIFQVHYRLFLALIGFVILLIFANAGGFSVLGLPTPEFFFNSPLIFFLIFIVAIVMWMGSRG